MVATKRNYKSIFPGTRDYHVYPYPAESINTRTFNSVFTLPSGASVEKADIRLLIPHLQSGVTNYILKQSAGSATIEFRKSGGTWVTIFSTLPTYVLMSQDAPNTMAYPFEFLINYNVASILQAGGSGTYELRFQGWDHNVADFTAAVQFNIETELSNSDVASSVDLLLVTAKLPSSTYLMGSSVATSKDDDIDAIKTSTDKLFGPTTLGTPTVDSFADKVMNKDGTQTFSKATDSLEAISDDVPTVSQIWDEPLASHVVPNSMGSNQNLIDNIESDVTTMSPNVAAILANTDAIEVKLPTNFIMGSSDVDAHDTDIDSILADTNQIQGKLPTNYLMGSSDVDNHDDVIDSIYAALRSASGTVVTAVGNSSTDFKTNLGSTSTDHWKDEQIYFLTGDNSGQIRRITAFNNTTAFITVSAAFRTTPTAGDSFIIIPRYTTAGASLTESSIVTALLNELLAGYTVAGSVGKSIGYLGSILADTDELQTDWKNTGRLDVILDSIKADTGAILIDTAELQTDWTNNGRLDTILDSTLAHGVSILADTNELQLDWKNTGRLDNILDAIKLDSGSILADTNELQTDWKNTGRLDNILDSVKSDTGSILADTAELQTDWTNNGRLDLIIDAILADTNELQVDFVNGGRLDLLIDSILEDTGTTLPTQIADLITRIKGLNAIYDSIASLQTTLLGLPEVILDCPYIINVPYGATVIDQVGGIGSSDVTIDAQNIADFEVTEGVLLIGSEYILYTGITGNTFTGCTRGAFGTTPAIHANGVAIYDVKAYRVRLIVKDATGNLMNADSAPTIAIADYNGTVELAATPMAAISTGVYGYNYLINSHAIAKFKLFTFSITKNSITGTRYRGVMCQEEPSGLSTISEFLFGGRGEYLCTEDGWYDTDGTLTEWNDAMEGFLKDAQTGDRLDDVWITAFKIIDGETIWSSKPIAQAVSDEDGTWLLWLDAGTYTFVFEKDGYQFGGYSKINRTVGS